MNLSFDKQELNIGDIIYQIVTLSNQPTDIHLRAHKITDISIKGKIEVIYIDINNVLQVRNDVCNNVCKDPKVVVDHWIETLQDQIVNFIPKRLEVLQHKDFINDALLISDKLKEMTGEGLVDNVEI